MLFRSRIEGNAGGVENLFGTTPRFGDLMWEGSDFSQQQFEQITSIDKSAWIEEVKLHTELFEKLQHHLPAELVSAKAQLEKRLAA